MNITIKPQILATLRKNRRMPVEAIAAKLKLSAEEYENYEKNETEVLLKDADKIAKIFHRNWSVFLLNEAPEPPNFDQDNRTQRNQRKGIGYKTYAAIEEASYLLDFITSIGENKASKIPKFASRITAKDLVAEFRGAIDLPFDNQPHFQTSAEAVKFWVAKFGEIGINVSSYELGDNDNVRAFSIFRGHKAAIVLGADETDNGRLFSLMHELAHILDRNTGICDLQRDDVESYCNAFASEMLIPDGVFSELVAKLHVTDDSANECTTKLARRLKVSRLAVLTRLLQAKQITAQKYDELSHAEYMKFSAYKEQKRRRQAANSHPKINPYTVRRARLGNHFLGEILNAYHQARISPFEASNYLGFKVQTISKFNDWVGRHES